MSDPDGIEIQYQGATATLWMNRPDRHNAFDERSIAALTAGIAALDADERVRAIVLAGRGSSFSAGADLNWMERQSRATPEDNLEDARCLARMLRTFYRCSKPTIARVHGAALGGGMGLVSVCDVALASTQATFGTTEVRIGLIPATIGPYVIAAIGGRAAGRYFVTGERFGAVEACRIGLVHESVPPDSLDRRIEAVLEGVLASGPRAQAAAKLLLRSLQGRPLDSDPVLEETALSIARIRQTAEGREGIQAFLGKRRPGWTVNEVDGGGRF